MEILQHNAPSDPGAKTSDLRFWLCGIVVCFYFATFASLLSIAKGASAPDQIPFVTAWSVVLTACCMIASVATTAIFVFAQRGE